MSMEADGYASPSSSPPFFRFLALCRHQEKSKYIDTNRAKRFEEISICRWRPYRGNGGKGGGGGKVAVAERGVVVVYAG